MVGKDVIEGVMERGGGGDKGKERVIKKVRGSVK
jgi:hypothetical protein